METQREGVERCPTGCDFDELEIGTEGESVMALFGMPYMNVRCGKCGFNGKPQTVIGLATTRQGAIAKWNDAVLAARAAAE